MYYHLRDGLHLNKQALGKWANIAWKVAEKNKKTTKKFKIKTVLQQGIVQNIQ